MRQFFDDLAGRAMIANGVIVVVILAGFAIAELRYGGAGRDARVNKLVGWMFALAAPWIIVQIGASDISRSLGGYWRPADFRSSQLFVDMNWCMILLVAPVFSLFGWWSLWSHRRRA